MSTCHPRYITTRKQKYILHTRKKCSKSCVNFVSQLVAIFKTGSTARMASPSTAGRAIAHRCGARGTRLDQLLNHEGETHGTRKPWSTKHSTDPSTNWCWLSMMAPCKATLKLIVWFPSKWAPVSSRTNLIRFRTARFICQQSLWWCVTVQEDDAIKHTFQARIGPSPEWICPGKRGKQASPTTPAKCSNLTGLHRLPAAPSFS